MDTEHSPRTDVTIGIAGIGRMGTPLAHALSDTFPTRVFDTDPDRKTAAPGAQWCSTLQELAERSNVFMTVLPGPKELHQCVTDALPALRPGTLCFDLTSGDPNVTRALAALASDRGIDVVSAPMGASVAEAAAHDLTFFVSGSDQAVARAEPILKELSRTGGVQRAGTRAEDGQIVKLLANGLWFANAVATSEAMLIGQGLGLTPPALHDLLRNSAGGSRFLDEHFGHLLDGDYLETFGIDRVVEELDTIHTMAKTAQVTTPMLDASARIHHAALDRYGPALGELLAVKLLEDDTGQRLRR